MVADAGVGAARRARGAVWPARFGALAVAIVVLATAATGADDATALRAGLVFVAALVAAVVCLVRLGTSAWWIAPILAGLGISGTAAVGGVEGWAASAHPVDVQVGELTWLAGSLALVIVMFVVGHRTDGSLLGLSRLDAGIAAVSVGAVLHMTLGAVVADAGVEANDRTLVIAHATLLVVAVAVVARAVVVDALGPAGSGLATGAVLVSLSGLVRSVEGLVSVGWLPHAAAVAAAGAAGALALAGLAPDAASVHRPVRRTATLPDERVVLLALAALLPPAVVVADAVRGDHIDAVVLAAWMAALVVLVVVRLHLTVSAVRVRADREALVRQTAARLAAAPDAPTVQRAALDAVSALVGPSMRYAAWVANSETEGFEISELVVSSGSRDPSRLGLLSVLDAIGGQPAGFEHLESSTGDAIVATVLDRPWCGLVAGAAESLSADVDEALSTLASQAAMALEGVTRAEELLHRRSEARFQELVRHTNDAILIVDRDGIIRYQTPSVVKILGYLAVDLDGQPVQSVVDADHLEPFDHHLHLLVHRSPDRPDVLDVQLRRADGALVEVEIVGSNLLENPDVGGVVLTVRDVSRRRELEAQLRHQAFHDSLTGLANRTLFVDRLAHALDVRRRTAGAGPAVAFVDLDDFKNVNDTLGHAAGDRLLSTIAERIGHCIRTGDTAARLGGDEFAVLFEDAASTDVVLEAADRILEAVQEPVTLGSQVVRVRASIGIATRHDGAGTAADLLRCADLAMYSAKANGKGCVERFEPEMHSRMVSKLSTTADLERAIAEEALRVAYQPLVEMPSGRVMGFEALVRWDHAVRGAVPPSEFIPVAEETGLIVTLGAWVLDEACRQLAAWRATGPDDLKIHVNISARQLREAGFVDHVRETLDANGLPNGSVVLELTESILLTDVDGMLDALADLRGVGVEIAIDDFGTGYSSLSYLQQVPFDVLKIDRTFVSTLVDVEPADSLVRTIVDLADRLGVETIAEGIERPVEQRGLVALGCRAGQGYLFGAPVPAAEAQAMVGGLRLVDDDQGVA